MATNERVILDPSEVSTERTELEITDWISSEGLDWGDAEIAAELSEATRGEYPVDYRVPNRQVTGKMALGITRGTVSPQQFRAKLQKKVALFQTEGGHLKRVTNSGGTVFADVVDAKLHVTSAPGWASEMNVDPEGSLELSLIPDFYGAEITKSDHTTSSNPELIWTETGISGDYPARVRVVVDNDGTASWQGVVWSFRSRHYDNSARAQMEYEAEELQAIGGGALAAQTGASGGTIIKQTSIYPAWTPLVNFSAGGTGALIHTGTNRVFARVWVTGGTTTSIESRLRWGIGDLTSTVSNERVIINGRGTATSTFHVVDYGSVHLTELPVGTHQWGGVIDVQTDVLDTNAKFGVDKVWIANADEGMGIIRAGRSVGAGGLTPAAFDDFSLGASGGTLGAAAAILGGNWDEAGDTDPFLFEGTNGWVYRTAESDTGSHFAILDGSSTIAAVEVQASVSQTVNFTHSGSNWIDTGVVVRYVDTNNYLVAAQTHYTSKHSTYLILVKKVAGVETYYGYKESYDQDTAWHDIKLTVDAAGNAFVYSSAQGAEFTGAKLALYADTDLKTGGALDDGKIGIWDNMNYTATGTFTRRVDNFFAATGTTAVDAGVFGGQSIQLTTDGIYREVTSGTTYAPVASVGDLPRLPVAGLEGRTTEILIKPSTGDLTSETVEGTATFALSGQVFYRPCWLFVDD